MGDSIQQHPAVFVVTPGDVVTGGPEACHQLAHVSGASIVYYPFHSNWETPQPYQRYCIRTALVQDIEPGSIVVLPETYGSLFPRFAHVRIFFWWLSVNNFLVLNAHYDDGRLLDPDRMRVVARHLYQSDYAKAFLEYNDLTPMSRLSDYLADEYMNARPTVLRENIIAYNQAKGAATTELILAELNDFKAVPIQGMSRDQICQLLGRAKVYMDFGEHPGKDRIPREAAMFGACVVTNRRGSAAFPADMPTPDLYKINDREPGFEHVAARVIRMIMNNFEFHQKQFDHYRHVISDEPRIFLEDIGVLRNGHFANST